MGLIKMSLKSYKEVPLFSDNVSLTTILRADLWGGRDGDNNSSSLRRSSAVAGELFIYDDKIYRCIRAGTISVNTTGPILNTGSALFNQVEELISFTGVDSNENVFFLSSLANNQKDLNWSASDAIQVPEGTGALISDGFRIYRTLRNAVLSSGSNRYLVDFQNSDYYEFVEFVNKWSFVLGSKTRLKNKSNLTIRYDRKGSGIYAGTIIPSTRFSGLYQNPQDIAISKSSALTFYILHWPGSVDHAVTLASPTGSVIRTPGSLNAGFYNWDGIAIKSNGVIQLYKSNDLAGLPRGIYEWQSPFSNGTAVNTVSLSSAGGTPPGGTVKGMANDSQDRIHVITADGIYRLNGTSWTQVLDDSSFPGGASTDVRGLAFDENDNYIIVEETGDGEAWIRKNSTWKKIVNAKTVSGVTALEGITYLNNFIYYIGTSNLSAPDGPVAVYGYQLGEDVTPEPFKKIIGFNLQATSAVVTRFNASNSQQSQNSFTLSTTPLNLDIPSTIGDTDYWTISITGSNIEISGIVFGNETVHATDLKEVTGHTRLRTFDQRGQAFTELDALVYQRFESLLGSATVRTKNDHLNLWSSVNNTEGELLAWDIDGWNWMGTLRQFEPVPKVNHKGHDRWHISIEGLGN